MAKKNISVSNKNIGIALFIALLLQYVFPAMKLGSFAFIGTIIIFIAALYLTFF